MPIEDEEFKLVATVNSAGSISGTNCECTWALAMRETALACYRDRNVAMVIKELT